MEQALLEEVRDRQVEAWGEAAAEGVWVVIVPVQG